jgi:hypothetical protein
MVFLKFLQYFFQRSGQPLNKLTDQDRLLLQAQHTGGKGKDPQTHRRSTARRWIG